MVNVDTILSSADAKVYITKVSALTSDICVRKNDGTLIYEKRNACLADLVIAINICYNTYKNSKINLVGNE